MSERPALRALADEVGILPAYHDIGGREHLTSDAQYEALLAAMGYDASSEEGAARALEARRRARIERVVDPVVVVTGGGRHPGSVPVWLPGGVEGRVAWSASVRLESGGTLHAEGRATARDGSAVLRLPRLPETGYHRLHVQVETPAGPRRGDAMLLAAPRTCWTVREALGGRRAAGIWTNLYTVRRAGDWGVGDFGTLRELAAWAGREGAEFLGVNPLHALWDRGHDVSPYSPISRLFRNAIYVDVAEVPELAESSAAAELIASPGFAARLADVRHAPLVDYAGVMTLKRAALERLHATFRERHATAGTERGRAYAEYRERQGTALRDFATYTALAEHFEREGGSIDWRTWPDEFRRPDSSAVEAFRREQAEPVDYHAWVQFEAERQLGLAARGARDAGMAIGLYQDLAVGSSAAGSDAWSYGDLFRTGASVGAPPDDYSTEGQDWGLPPMDPDRLAARGFDYWITLVRSAMQHAGALRIDHAMGLQRLFWIPAGRPASEGAYVRYPERALLAILALESRRHEAVVVAEDLGTVPEGFGTLLASWGILSSQLLWFERTEGGGFEPAASYSRRALVTTTTHDHTPVAAFWEGGDLEVRRELGLLDDAQLDGARGHRQHERHLLIERLRADGAWDGEEWPVTVGALGAAVHRFLARTPAPLLGLSLDDLGRETRPVNIPGVGPDRYPGTWSRKMRMTLEQLRGDAGVREMLAGAGERLRARGP
ncbi:MAG TPA: 4-alpha-glucanotransferase [Gemmatimonadales bacterium]|nr:4-alpha-glucanotransferase [Gemmatimonadales bacterium]